MRSVLRALYLSSCVSSSAFAASGPSIFSNAQMFPVGSRAAGMGGAYTALACDEASLHYNPAALSCAQDSHLELAANVYMLQHFGAPNALGPGQDIDATTYHPVPSIAGFVRLMDRGDPKTKVGRIGLGFSVAVPQSIFLVVDPPDLSTQDYLSVSVRDQLLTADLGLGLQLTETIAVGFSVGGAMRSAQSKEQGLLVADTPVECGVSGQCLQFLLATEDLDLTAIGLRAKMGARYTPTDKLSIGLVFTTPSLDIFGSSKLVQHTTIAFQAEDMGTIGNFFGAVPVRYEGSSGASLPAKIAAGVAYETKGLTLSADLSLILPRTVRSTKDLKRIEISGAAVSEDVEDNHVLHPVIQPNINVGAEFGLSKSVVLDLGAFTDFSGTSDEDLQRDEASRAHHFGGTVALGLLGRQAKSWFGLSFQVGSGKTFVRSTALTFEEVVSGNDATVEAGFTRWNIVGIIGSSYSFIDDSEIGPAESDSED